MRKPTKIRAILSGDGNTVSIRGDLWRDKFHIDRLPGWLTTYRDLEKRNPAKKFYAETIAALEGIQRQHRERTKT